MIKSVVYWDRDYLPRRVVSVTYLGPKRWRVVLYWHVGGKQRSAKRRTARSLTSAQGWARAHVRIEE